MWCLPVQLVRRYIGFIWIVKHITHIFRFIVEIFSSYFYFSFSASSFSRGTDWHGKWYWRCCTMTSKHAANYCIAVLLIGLCSKWPEVNHNFHAICIHFRNWIRWQHIILIKRNNKSPKKNGEETFILPRDTPIALPFSLSISISLPKPISVSLPSAHRRIWNRAAHSPWRRNSQNCKFMDGSLRACTPKRKINPNDFCSLFFGP